MYTRWPLQVDYTVEEAIESCGINVPDILATGFEYLNKPGSLKIIQQPLHRDATLRVHIYIAVC